MSTKKKGARLTVAQRIDQARIEGVATGVAQEKADAAFRAKAAKDAAPRRSFWIQQTVNGFEMNESTIGSARGPSWTSDSAEHLGGIIEDLIAKG